MKLKKLVAEANEKDIDDALSKLAEQHKGSEPISSKRASKIGDILVIDFVGSVDGEKFDGGSAEGHHLELGSNQFIPGFEEQLVGKKAGASVKVEVKFPENYSQANLSGKNAFFDTKIKEIRQSTKVEIDDQVDPQKYLPWIVNDKYNIIKPNSMLTISSISYCTRKIRYREYS